MLMSRGVEYTAGLAANRRTLTWFRQTLIRDDYHGELRSTAERDLRLSSDVVMSALDSDLSIQ